MSSSIASHLLNSDIQSLRLRNHQKKVIKRMLDTRTKHRLLFVAGTGSGKTIASIITAMHMLKYKQRPAKKTQRLRKKTECSCSPAPGKSCSRNSSARCWAPSTTTSPLTPSPLLGLPLKWQIPKSNYVIFRMLNFRVRMSQCCRISVEDGTSQRTNERTNKQTKGRANE